MKTIPIDIKNTKGTVINWQNNLKQIVDGYRSYTSIPHSVQKDAIQNSWDARIDKVHAKNWKISFELVKTNKLNYFSFTDYGTTGLTGRILKPEELDQDLPVEERWGRFENVAFTKDPSENALGARGRGKFIFVGASNYFGETQDGTKINHLILYDTRRYDSSYRFGFRTITTTESPVQAYDNENGAQMLKEFTDNVFTPFSHPGTRIIIVSPIDELIEEVENGHFMNFVEETWWEIIRDYKAHIELKYDSVLKIAKINKYFKFPEKDSARFKISRLKKSKLPNAPIYNTLESIVTYDAKGNIPKDIQGISIQRGGMKVCCIPVKYADKEIAESIYGYVKLDKKLEDAIREHEGIEHYSFDFSKKIPRFLKMYIEDECAKFLRNKLNYGGSPSGPMPGELSAEKKALYLVNKIAGQLGILGKGVIPRGGGGGGSSEKKLICLSLEKFIFPNQDIIRVNYNEYIKIIQLNLINDSIKTQKVGVRFSIYFDNGQEVCVFINNENYIINPNERMNLISLDEILIERSVFPYKGKYSFKAILVSMEPENEGDILHKLTRNIWVEEDPPQKGIFEEVESVDFPEEEKTIMGISEKIVDSNSYKFLYNRKHPAKKAVEKDEGKLTKYLLELMCMELAWIDLRNPEHKLFNEEDLESEEKIVRKLSKFIGEIKYKVYYGDNN